MPTTGIETGLSVSLSSQLALERRLGTLADNVANSGTVGFRATHVRFAEIEQRVTGGDESQTTSFASRGRSVLSPTAGTLVETGARLDVAIKGEGWFALQGAAGKIMTRDGRFQMDAEGQLRSVNGDEVLDPGGAPLALNVAAGPPTIGSDGSIVQNGQQVGAIGLYAFDPGTDPVRIGTSGILAQGAPVALVDGDAPSVLQGYVEQANVDPVREMTNLITIHRTFDNVAAMVRKSDAALEKMMQILGGNR
ncbi:flagellar basal-body rod protein FlgF [Ahrensia sp. R2A130]|uniref:flagellar basal-body rod protein FlgF n=1 Tax=Ahrensia sp. R2A130 TaxID=744979 RepID=UPI0001E083CA|nr:flagellar basal-body rod protein FlgF [Ahrensia sp. R2A130]EFL89501.1 flagellar basal-body rod protein FlgF [Ahrensia sp. R2A130]